MDMSFLRYCISLILLTVFVEATTANNELLLEDSREPRVSGRIVKLYTGARPEPVNCNGEGFQSDPHDCAVFYRCVKSGNGKYTVFRFQCGPGTVYDPDVEICNHPRSTKRSECGGLTQSSIGNIHVNDIEGIHQEIPSPIQTIKPVYTERTSTAKYLSSAKPSIAPSERPTMSTPYPFLSSTKSQSEKVTSLPTSYTFSTSTMRSSSEVTSLSTKRPLEMSTKSEVPYFSAVSKSTFIPQTTSITRQPNLQIGDMCLSDGFVGDSENCRKFYRCVGNQRGGFIKYEFSCSESTVWDDDIQGCNHPWAVKRSTCGRSLSFDKKSTSYTVPSVTVASSTSHSVYQSNPTTTEQSYTFGLKLNKTIQQQVQISYGTNVTQTQTQISKGNVIQNQTQINFGDRVNKTKYLGAHQNQTQISYGTAVSQTQTQIDHGHMGVQTQLQIDHSQASSQTQTQIHDSTSKPTTTSKHEQYSTNINEVDNNECLESGFMGDSNDCKRFYRCVDNGRGGFTRYEYFCGDGTVWDAEIEACNHAWAVKKCGGKVSTEATVTTSTEKSPQSHYTDSSKSTQNYYTTSESSINEDTGYGGNVHDNEQYSTSTISSSTTQKITTTENSKGEDTECTSSGFIGDRSNCKIFYRCVDNGKGSFTKHEFKCGEGTLWDPDIEACNHAWAVKKCGGGASTHIDQVESTTKDINKETVKSSTHAQTSFSVTQSSTLAMQNDDYDTGYGPHNDEIDSTIKTTKQPQNQENNNISNECESSGFMGDNNDCKKFYRCVDNGNGGYTRYEFTCGEGTVWDPKIEACNHAWAVESCGRNGTLTGHQETTSYHIESTSNGEINNGYTTQNYKDTEKPTYSTISSIATSSMLSNESNKCKNSGFIGDNKDCKKFYRCVDNGDGSYTRYEFSCGEGTVWDPKIDACNHAWAVEKCGGSNELSQESQVTPQYLNDDEISNEYGTQNSIDEQPDKTTQNAVTTPSNNLPAIASDGNNKCTKIGFSGDKNDCRKFYRCVDDGKGGFIRYEFYCGEGTVWDQRIETCNYASEVDDCDKTNIENSSMIPHNESTSETVLTWSESQSEGYNHYSTEKTTTAIESYPENEISNEVCSKEGFFGVQNDCVKFYRCVDNGQGGFTKYEFSCGEGTYWNEEIQACDHLLDKRCNEKENKPTTKVPHHENDEIYTETTAKTSTSTTVSISVSSSSQKPQTTDNLCESEGFHGDTSNCKRFYRCVDDGKGSYIKYDFTCGDGTIWNQEIQACDHESDNNKCLNIASSTETNESQSESDKYSSTMSTTIQEQHSTGKIETSSSLSVQSEECSSEGFYANPSDCTKFIRCVSNEKGGYTKYEFSCGEGTIWVQEIQACDHDNGITSCYTQTQSSKKPETNNNSHQTSSESSITSSTLASQPSTPSREEDEYDGNYSESTTSETEKCSAEGFYANKNDCRQFYRCVENSPGKYTRYDFVCGEGTAWDTDIQACNHISEVKSCVNQGESHTKPVMQDEEVSQTSESTIKPTTSSESGTESSSSSSKDTCDREGYYGNVKDCKKFYRCVDNGKGGFTKYDYTCGDGTIWDQDITACNHPQDVTNPSCNQDQGESGTSTSTSSSTSSSSSSTTSTTERNNQSSSNCSQEESSKKPASNITCNKAGFYANPNDCKKFYRCVDWDGNGQRFSVYHFDCGEGTIWDPAVETCNYEDSVYPPRDCTGSQSQSENVGQESTTTEVVTTTAEASTQQASTSEQTTTLESNTSENPTTQESTTSEQTTTQESTTSQQTTTQQSTTSEKTTTQQSSTSEQTTTQESTTSEVTTTQQSTTSEQTTTQQSTTSEQTTTQQSTTTEQTTSQQSTTSEQTTTQQTSTSEQTTAQQSTTTEQSTTQAATTNDLTTSSTEETTQLSTTEQSTTEESTSEQQTTTDQTTESSTTEQSTTTNESETTTAATSSSEKPCPDMDADQYALVCPTSFRRHPKYCNIFYQCTEDDDSHEVKIALFNCPNNTIYDESKTQCVEENKADKKCSGEIATRGRVKRLGAYKEPIMVNKDEQKCLAVGHFPFEKDTECSPGFLKCEKSKSGKLRGYVYRCPEGYFYWSISKRCELIDNVRDCKRSTNNWSERWEIPIERNNVASKKIKQQIF